MTDRAGNKDKTTNSSSKNTHHDAVRDSSHHHSSQQKDPPSRSHEENIPNDTFIKRYKVMEKIGEGSYSEVLKCQNRLDGMTVACKRLKHIYKSLEEVANISEIATLRTIPKHMNILQMIEIHYDKALGKVSLVFELMDINLYELIKDRKRLLPESRVRAIMFQLFRALRHLHKLGIFHRDIKPENILIKAKTDQLKLGDLGSVRGMFSRPPYTEYISTRWYRSPECLLTAGHYSHKMDVWAAGCVFYEVLTLRPLFPGSSEIDQINRINNVLGPPPLKLLETFQKQAEMERETYRGQSQLNRRQQIQKVLNGYSSRYIVTGDSSHKTISSNSLKNYRRNNMEFHFAGKEGTGLDKILPAHITREAKEIIKSCLLYDPEQRPTAQRIVQLSYFAELRESYAKNPEKVSSKSVVLICGDTVTDYCNPIELGTLGDHKMRYRRGHVSQRSNNTTKVSKVPSKILLDKKPSSIKSTDINNNVISRRRSSTSNENVVMMARSSQSKQTEIASSSASKMKVLDRGSTKFPKRDASSRDRQRKSSSLVKTFETRAANRRSNNSVTTGHTETSQVPSSKFPVRSKNSSLAGSQQLHRLPEPLRKKQQQMSSSTTSFESVKSPNKRERRYGSQQRDREGQKDSKTSFVSPPDFSQSPYVKPPSELKFLRNKIKSDHQNSRYKVPLLQPQLSQIPAPQQVSSMEQQPVQRVPVVPLKVAAAAIKYAMVNNSRKVRADPVALTDTNVTTDQTESSGTKLIPGGGRRGDYSATDDTLSYATATASSSKIGKLRFRQTSLQQQTINAPAPPPSKVMKESSTTTHSPSLQRSKIPILTTDESTGIPKSSRRNTKLLNSPPEQRREPGSITEKWRNTETPRVIPMSPERERNIKLLKESLTLDKDKRVKLVQHEEKQEQDIINNNVKATARKELENMADVKPSHGRKVAPSKIKYDYTSQETTHSNGEQQPGNFSSAGGFGGKYRNSTTDYENPDVQETSSASAAALENQQRNLFNAATRNKRRVVVPSMESAIKKPIPVKKSSELYPPEMLHLYSSRYRGPDTTMNILKDSGNYVKRSNPESRVQEVKEQLNQKFEQRRQRQVVGAPSSQQIGDHPSKISERSSYGHYSSSLLGAGEEDQFTRVMGSRMERRPPLPPVGGIGSSGRTAGHRGYQEVTLESTHQRYDTHHGRRASVIPAPCGEKESGGRTNRRSLSNAEHLQKSFKDAVRKKAERMRSTMRDDVFCSSDDDVVISMRKKFDSLISERARKLSESLKGKPDSSHEAEKHKPLVRKARESNSEEERMTSRRSKNNGQAADKSKKWARRELRARMAESLTTNNFSIEDNWRVPEMLENRGSNDNGDWMLPSSRYTDKTGGGKNDHNSSYNPSSVLRARKNNAETEFQESLKYHQTNRIHPFPVQEQQAYRRGQIFTPPSNKPVYQSPQLGTLLQDRKLRYSHNSPMSVAVAQVYGSGPGKSFKDVTSLKKQQRI